MRQVTLGKSGLSVSAIGFGGIPIQRITEEEAVDVIHTALDAGVNFIDTAAGYGDSQTKIGTAITNRREALVLASKSTAENRDGILRDIERGCREMGVDCIDLYQLHGVSRYDKWERIRGPDGALEGLREAWKRGMIGHLGYTSHSMEVAMELVNVDEFETVQFPFNMVTREPGDELIPAARENNLGFIVMKPLCGGEYDDAELAFRFLNDFPDLVPIPGIETSAEIRQIIEINESGRRLEGESRKRAEDIVARLGKQFCRRCGYCMPCPQGVPVTQAMIWDSMRARLPETKLKEGLAPKLIEALPKCTECGACEEACPYDLPIIEKMRRIRREAETVVAN